MTRQCLENRHMRQVTVLLVAPVFGTQSVPETKTGGRQKQTKDIGLTKEIYVSPVVQ